ncbi:MAG: hypothetical protein K0S08_2197 [Gammaproteobacteria bacterium]|jgi:hypothetical protein|nr:hypothetical protein [Gammaproteobacteria bacterium]
MTKEQDNGYEAKYYTPKGYKNLREGGVSTYSVSSFFKTSPDKLEALSSEHVRALIKYNPDISYDSLSEIFDEDPKLFDYVVQDRRDLICCEDFDTVVARYRKALHTQHERENCSFYDGKSFDIEAEADYLSENGLSYNEEESDANQESYYSYSSY